MDDDDWDARLAHELKMRDLDRLREQVRKHGLESLPSFAKLRKPARVTVADILKRWREGK